MKIVIFKYNILISLETSMKKAPFHQYYIARVKPTLVGTEVFRRFKHGKGRVLCYVNQKCGLQNSKLLS